MKTMVKIGKVTGTKIFVHWTFLLPAVWMVAINCISVIRPSEIAWSLLLILAFIFSLLIHEYSHALAGVLFGVRRQEILMLPSGSVGGPLNKTLRVLEKALILTAGPAANLAIAAILKFYVQPYAAYWNEPENIGVVTQGNFLFQLHLINLGLGLVNLIPALPLDGGYILREILSFRRDSGKAGSITAYISRAIAYGSLLTGIVILSLPLVLFGIYVGLTWKSEDEFSRAQQNELTQKPDISHPRVILRAKGIS